MPARIEQTTAYLADWAAGFTLADAPAPVIERLKALLLDHLRVVAVGARLPWSRDARRYALELGGRPTSTVLYDGDRLDAARAAFVNGSFAHACDLDDTHVGSMHHAGASVWPARASLNRSTSGCSLSSSSPSGSGPTGHNSARAAASNPCSPAGGLM